MTKFFILISALAMIGCASDSASHDSAPKKKNTASVEESSSDQPDSDSKVLKKKECPRGSTMQNGKCTLSVESDD